VAAAGCATTKEELPASLVVAANPKAERLHVVRETPHLELRHGSASRVTEADLALCEDHLVEVAHRLGTDPPRRILYLLVTPERMLALTGASRASESLTAPAMALFPEAEPLRVRFDGIVLSSLPRSTHELTHCVSARLVEREDFLYRSPLVFEGLAMALEPRPEGWIEERLAVRRESSPTPRPSDLVAGFPGAQGSGEEEAAYLVAGSFVSWLLERFGTEPFVALLRRGRKDRFFEVFEHAYGRPFAEVEAEWATRR